MSVFAQVCAVVGHKGDYRVGTEAEVAVMVFESLAFCLESLFMLMERIFLFGLLNRLKNFPE